MTFDPPLQRGVLLRRYKRFLADVRLDDGTEVTAHCTNTGRMTGCSEPGSEVMLSYTPLSADGRTPRKLPFTLRLIRAGRTWVSVDTSIPNRVVADALRRRRIPELAEYDTVRTEVRFGVDLRSRIDVLLSDSSAALPDCYVEVKNVTLRGPGRAALFPDAVSERGLKHLRELSHVVAEGYRGVLLPFVARADCDHFDAAADIDPAWAAGLTEAAAAGVEIMPWRARIGRRGVHLATALPWVGAAARS